MSMVFAQKALYILEEESNTKPINSYTENILDED